MNKRFISKLMVFGSLLMCCLIIFDSGSAAVGSNSDFLQVDSITIEDRHGIIEGKSIPLEAIITPENTIASAVEWTSSNPSVVSCTKDGIITGVSSGGYADIKCKAKHGNVEDKIRIYCVEPIGDYVETEFKNYIDFIYAEPSQLKPIAMSFNYNKILRELFKYLSGVPLLISNSDFIPKEFTFSRGDCYILGKYNKYAYIAFVGKGVTRDGFVKHSRLEETNGIFLDLSPRDMDVWGNGKSYENKKLTTKYKGDIEWSVGDDEIVRFDPATKQVTGLKPGKTTITAMAEGVSITCTVHSLYQWPQTWTTQTNRDTNLYLAEGSSYKISRTVFEGTGFTVYGDNGSDDGWAYGNIDGTKTWGYIPISHLSNKGTISQYSSLGWVWPVSDVKNGVNQTTKARYISSPYGWRDTDPAQHKGVDITNGISSNSDFANSVDGYEVVSAFAGKVIYVCEDKYKSCGYCVAIRATEKDPITGKHYVAIYMHLKYIPDVELNENISANKKLGYVGDTGNSGGSHLHFEVNNQNLSYGQKIYYENNSDKEMVFGSVINPLFFYMNYYNLPESNSGKIKINPTCDAMDYRKPFWYGDDIKESKKP